MDEVSVITHATHYSPDSEWSDGLHAVVSGGKQTCNLAMAKDEKEISMTLYKHEVEALAAVLSAIAKNMEARA